MTSEPLLTFVDMSEVGELRSDGKYFTSKGEKPFTIYTKEVFSATESVAINVTVLKGEGATVWVGLLPDGITSACARHRLGSSDLPGSVACCIDDTAVRLFHGGKELWCVPDTDFGPLGFVEVHLKRDGKVSFEVNGNRMKECTVRMSGPLRLAASMTGTSLCVLDHKNKFYVSGRLFQEIAELAVSKQEEMKVFLSLAVVTGVMTVEDALQFLWLHDPESGDDEEEGEETTVSGGPARTPLEELILGLNRAIRKLVRELRQAANSAIKEAQLAERIQQAERNVAAGQQVLKEKRKILHEKQERLAELLSQQAMDGVHRATTNTHDSQRHRQNTL